VFRGPIDDQAAFDVENDVASFTGAFDGNQVEGDHTFQGEAFTFDGIIQQPVVEDTVTAGPPVQPAPLVGVIGEDVVIEPVADGGESDGSLPGAVAGGVLALVGAGLLLGAGRSMGRDCSAHRAALQSSITAHERAVEQLQGIDEQLKAIGARLEESRGRLEATAPGRAELRETAFTAELVPAPEAVLGDLVASRPGADEATRDAVFGHGLGLKQQQQLRMERAQAERAVADAAGAVRGAEAALAGCEGRPPRTLEEALRDRPQPSVVETREVM
jgi:hypothetical protein